MHSEWYANACLPKVFAEMRKTNRNRSIILHHNNESAHISARTTDFSKANNVLVMSHCPYSPDLSPCDFFLFPVVKNQMSGQRFSSPQTAVQAYERVISNILPYDWEKCFEEWFERMEVCIKFGGEYLE